MTGVGGKGKGSAGRGDRKGKGPITDPHVHVDQSRKRTNINEALPTNNTDQGRQDELDKELWRVCAGPRVYVPRVGDYVYYYLQGHLEQIEAYANHEIRVEMPAYNVPSKVLCKVVYAELKAETGTDEVFAQITLQPITKQDMQNLEDGNSAPLPSKTKVCFFSKKLTQSDTSTHGGFSVPKRPADECLPQLDSFVGHNMGCSNLANPVVMQIVWLDGNDMSKEPPAQELIATDFHGNIWRFRHIFRGQPKRHLLTSGWSIFVASKKLATGDSCIFLRGEDGELRIGIRRLMKKQDYALTTLISSHSMQHGILASAFHSISTRTIFSVYYHPWTSPSEFIIPIDQCDKSIAIDYSVGTRIRMAFKTEDCTEKRIAGTVVGIEDVDRIRWPNSEWRCLAVKWDNLSDRIRCPERVSPWDVELVEGANKKPASVLHRPKRPRHDHLSLPGCSNGVSQGQENNVTGVKESGPLKAPSFPYLVPQKNFDWSRVLMHDPFYPCPNGTVSIPSGMIVSSGLPNYWPATLATDGVRNSAVLSRNLSVHSGNSLNSSSEERRSSESKNENESPLSQSHGGKRYMLFGVNIASSPPELPLLQHATSNELESRCSVPPMSPSSISDIFQVSEPSNSVSDVPSGKQCKNCRLLRSCTKVIKCGTAPGRSVDLSRFDGYEELVCELDQMFDFNGTLIDGSSGWQVTFIDYEGHSLLIGDHPWEEFHWAVRRMLICPKEDIDKLSPSSPNPTPA